MVSSMCTLTDKQNNKVVSKTKLEVKHFATREDVYPYDSHDFRDKKEGNNETFMMAVISGNQEIVVHAQMTNDSSPSVTIFRTRATLVLTIPPVFGALQRFWTRESQVAKAMCAALYRAIVRVVDSS